MLTYYQPFLLPFLRLKHYAIAHDVKRVFYISFEDALWNLLQSKHIAKQSVIFIPDFYCMDVVKNIKLHGYTPVFYPLDNHFQIKKRKFEHLRKQYSPSVIIFFHACGIQQALLSDVAYIQQLATHTCIIEDAVHRLVNPENIRILHSNHVIIDSLRKTSPLHGSFIYGNPDVIDSLSPATMHEYAYQLYTTLLFLLFRFVFITGVFLRSNVIVRYAHMVILKAHDDVIGDSKAGHAGPWYIPFLHSLIDFTKIASVKNRQVKQYRDILKEYSMSNSRMYSIRIPKECYGLLHVFPIGYHVNRFFNTQRINTYLEKSGYPVWTKFPDCPWSIQRAVLFLPLGFHVEYNEIKDICNTLQHV